jgi:hypothetical protein
MQRFLFEHGAMPNRGENTGKEGILAKIAADVQSVHETLVVDRTYFLTAELLNSVNKPSTELYKAAEKFKDAASKLFPTNKELSIKLLDLPKQSKCSVMVSTLKAEKMPQDKINSIIKIWGQELPAEALAWLTEDEALLLSDVTIKV